MPMYLANHLCSNFCLTPEIQLRGGSGGISALGRIFQFGQIFRNLRRAIPIFLRGARAVNSQIAKPKRFEEVRRKQRISGGKKRFRAEKKAGFGQIFPEIFEDFGGKTHGIDTKRWFWRVLLQCVLFRPGISRFSANWASGGFGASGGFSEVGGFFA